MKASKRELKAQHPTEVWGIAHAVLSMAHHYERLYIDGGWNQYINHIPKKNTAKIPLPILKSLGTIGLEVDLYWEKYQSQQDKFFTREALTFLQAMFKDMCDLENSSEDLKNQITNSPFFCDLKPHHKKVLSKVDGKFIRENGGPSLTAQGIYSKIMGEGYGQRTLDSVKKKNKTHPEGLVHRDELLRSCLEKLFGFEPDEIKSIIKSIPKYSLEKKFKRTKRRKT